MIAARRHLLLSSGVLAVLAVLASLFVFSAARRPPASTPNPLLTATADAPRLTPADKAALSFFQTPAAPGKDNRSLFETDFFKPPAPKPVPVKVAPPPPVRTLSLIYRGFAGFPGGERIAYLSVDGNTVAFTAGASVKDGWTLDRFDSDEAVVVQGDQRVPVRFNQPATLPVTAQPSATDKP